MYLYCFSQFIICVLYQCVCFLLLQKQINISVDIIKDNYCHNSGSYTYKVSFIETEIKRMAECAFFKVLGKNPFLNSGGEFRFQRCLSSLPSDPASCYNFFPGLHIAFLLFWNKTSLCLPPDRQLTFYFESTEIVQAHFHSSRFFLTPSKSYL